MVLEGRHKFDSLIGKIPRPPPDDLYKRYWKEIDLCRELVWSSPSDGLQCFRIEEIDKIYDFLADLSPKFDVVQGRILGERLILYLMEVCYEIYLEEDRASAISISETPTIDSVAFSVRSSSSGSDKHNGKSIPVYEHCKK
ncbi:Retrovirus-related Pol polyprotein from transposon TNT 1-94 [Cucumis melo var. makuwa]|uniref:Retrovirus-related Pol polyprotein from transposon TNT 1-94 n=1 Tax=Cucumis melo var. makuwa TaxID=1194695 RepID=A0A5D3BRG8_CUCMM|nr:Retrovirus-related Pol polyprotein from transposon TNT 1-94 [Cucumis melo var. makuwa]TYK00699.1 Retrovirus-related Pol polyprotein from transposon TNT 1-94 [Cucumis melo var. makuwa]